jgi:hypothetical protein
VRKEVSPQFLKIVRERTGDKTYREDSKARVHSWIDDESLVTLEDGKHREIMISWIILGGNFR